MKIYVRRKHIEKGKREDSKNCPIALACKEFTKEDTIVLYGRLILGGQHSFLLPSTARQFIRHFDAGKPVKPFSFVLTTR